MRRGEGAIGAIGADVGLMNRNLLGLVDDHLWRRTRRRVWHGWFVDVDIQSWTTKQWTSDFAESIISGKRYCPVLIGLLSNECLLVLLMFSAQRRTDDNLDVICIIQSHGSARTTILMKLKTFSVLDQRPRGNIMTITSL